MKFLILLIGLIVLISGCTATETEPVPEPPAESPLLEPAPEVPPEPVPEPEPEPVPEPEPEPEPEPTVTQLAILADEKGYMLNGAAITTLSFVQGEQVEITFSYDDADIYFSGLDIEATNSAFPPQKYTKGSGATNTVTFTAQESFHIKAYWPATRNLKATLVVTVE